MSPRSVAACLALATRLAPSAALSGPAAPDAVELDMLEVTATGALALRGLNRATPAPSASRLGRPRSVELVYDVVF